MAKRPPLATPINRVLAGRGGMAAQRRPAPRPTPMSTGSPVSRVLTGRGSVAAPRPVATNVHVGPPVGAPAPGAPGAPAPAPGTPAPAPAGGGSSRPAITPFFTPDDIIAMNSWVQQANDARAQWMSDLTNEVADYGVSKAELGQQARAATGQVADDAAARGIFRSSIKDAAVYDIEAQRSLQQGLLDQKMRSATSDYDTFVSRYGGTMSNGQKVATTPEEAAGLGAPLGTEAARFQQGYLAKKRQNAVDLSNSLAPPPPAPAAPAPPKPTPSTMPKPKIVTPTRATTSSNPGLYPTAHRASPMAASSPTNRTLMGRGGMAAPKRKVGNRYLTG